MSRGIGRRVAATRREAASNRETATRREPARGRLAAALLASLLVIGAAAPLAAQEEHHHGGAMRGTADGVRLGVQAVGVATHVAPGIGGESVTEAYLTQPAIMAHASALDGRVGFVGMLNLEGATLRRGELTMGGWGEGYVDRRHPHTYLHEAVLTGTLRRGDLAASIAAGKGFAPFGTDDPMFRPFVKYPVNHHLSQVLERAIGIAAVRWGPATLEAGLFNGDEPLGPKDMPSLERFGDSWAARLTLQPIGGLQLQASHASLESPEAPLGGGYDHDKWSASARWERSAGPDARVYAMFEWAATQLWDDDREAQRLTTLLGEAAVRRRGVEVAGRVERSLRMEEERLADPYRSPYPHTDIHALGMTRWTTATLAASAGAAAGGVGFRPFVEVAYAVPRDAITPSLFEARPFYGADRIWSLSAGVRVGAGMRHERMGRYGVAAE